jgi:hypothetical protein
MSTEHTPGPWWFSQHDSIGRYDIGQGDVVMFRSVLRSDSGPGEAPITDNRDEHTQANARLIAAAPDLLEALRAATNDIALAAETAKARGNDAVFAELTSHLRIYRAAIAKAEGTTPR